MKNKYNLNEEVVSVVKSSIPSDSNIVNELMEILPVGREAIYRRLRGEVPFTFEEIAKLSLRMGFSLDALVGAKNNTRVVFNLNVLDLDNLNKDYCRRLNDYIEFFKKMRTLKSVKGRFAFSTLPYSFYLSFENLSRFRLYRWYYQVSKSQSSIPFSAIEMSEESLRAQRVFMHESGSIRKAVYILDREMFSSVAKDINYFFKLNLITLDELELLKKELLEMVNELEALAISGVYKTGMKITLYLANIHLESSHSHVESEVMGISHFRILGVNGLTSTNSQISDVQKDWIDSLKRCSTLITQSGEVDRFAFFRKQRIIISSIGYD